MNKPRIIATGDRNHHNVANMELVWLKVPQWEQREGFVHGFFGRKGGKSVGPDASLNLSVRVGDDIQTVKDNLCDLKKAVGPTRRKGCYHDPDAQGTISPKFRTNGRKTPAQPME